MRKLLGVAIVAALTAAPALAADKAGAPAIIPEFSASLKTSCYMQALGGGSIISSNPDSSTLPVSLSAQNWNVAGGIGCDVAYDKVVVGLFGRIEIPVDTSAGLIEADRSWQVGARLGYRKFGNMPSISFGFESAEFSLASIEVKRDSWFVGAGLELELTPHLALVTEYQYSGLGSSNLVGMPVDTDAHKIRVGIQWRFNSLTGE